MTITAPVAPVQVAVATTELVRADQVRVGDRIAHRLVSVTMQLDSETVAIVLDTPSGPCVDEVRPETPIRIQCRGAERASEDRCANCAVSPCVFCRAQELLVGYGISDFTITRSI